MPTLHSYYGHSPADIPSGYSLYNTSLPQKVSPICRTHYPLGTSPTQSSEYFEEPGPKQTTSQGKFIPQASVFCYCPSGFLESHTRVNSTKNDARPFRAPNMREASSGFICLADKLSRPHFRWSIWKVKVREAHYFALANIQKESSLWVLNLPDCVEGLWISRVRIEEGAVQSRFSLNDVD
jgi:hypothetical protein